MRTTSSTSFLGWQRDDPTPEEIADACRLIQQHWSQREHYRRAGRRVRPWLAGEGEQQVGDDDEWTPPLAPMGDGIGESWGRCSDDPWTEPSSRFARCRWRRQSIELQA